MAAVRAVLNRSSRILLRRVTALRSTRRSLIRPLTTSSSRRALSASVITSVSLWSAYQISQSERRFVWGSPLSFTVRAEDEIPHTDDDVFHLLSSLQDLAPVIDANQLLKAFCKELQALSDSGEVVLDEAFVIKLFHRHGVDDENVAQSIFKIMDWNHSGTLEPAEIAATLTLFQVGSDTARYKFLFRCLDLDRSGTVSKDEFRALLTALYEAHYHISGFTDPKDPEEWYIGLGPRDYHAIARLKANMLTRTIFSFADQNRDGELNMKEFLHWCKRGGMEVHILKSLLSTSAKPGV